MWNTLTRLIETLGHGTPRAAATPVGFDMRGHRFQVRVGDRWRDAGDEVTVPAGTRVQFVFELPRDHDVCWTGACETAVTLHRSTAAVRLDHPGPYVVQIEVLDLDGHTVETLRTWVTVEQSDRRAA